MVCFFFFFLVGWGVKIISFILWGRGYVFVFRGRVNLFLWGGGGMLYRGYQILPILRVGHPDLADPVRRVPRLHR